MGSRVQYATLYGVGVTAVVPVLVVTGPVGVGKTSVASELSELLDRAGSPHAFVDMDSLRWCYPRPSGDRFRAKLALRNLAAIWPNFEAAGAKRLIVSEVVESRDDLDRLAVAVPGADIYVVLLSASIDALLARVERRELGAGRERHLERA